MTVSGNEHRLIVDYILSTMKKNAAGVPYPDPDEFVAGARAIAPDIEQEDFDRASQDAQGIWAEYLEVEKAKLDAMDRLRSIFHGMPADMSFMDCAVTKARRGDAFALSVCKDQGFEV